MSVSYATKGTGSGRRYVPKELVVTLTLAGDVSRQPGIGFAVTASSSACSYLRIEYANGARRSSPATWRTFCGQPGTNDLYTIAGTGSVVSGRTIVVTVPLRALPPDFRAGTTFEAFTASAELRDPLDATTSVTMLDEAGTSGRWKLG